MDLSLLTSCMALGKSLMISYFVEYNKYPHFGTFSVFVEMSGKMPGGTEGSWIDVSFLFLWEELQSQRHSEKQAGEGLGVNNSRETESTALGEDTWPWGWMMLTRRVKHIDGTSWMLRGYIRISSNTRRVQAS